LNTQDDNLSANDAAHRRRNLDQTAGELNLSEFLEGNRSLGIFEQRTPEEL
jgi:hypothetical protein